MRLSTTLSVYIGRNFLLSFVVLFGLFLLLILLFDSVELMRRAAAKPNVSFSLVMETPPSSPPRVPSTGSFSGEGLVNGPSLPSRRFLARANAVPDGASCLAA